MKAYYKTVLRGDSAKVNEIFADEKPEDVHKYVLLEMTEPCCQEMKGALESEAIKFGEFDAFFLNQDCNVNFAGCRPYPEGAAWDEYPIRFCPFCGQKVETEERQRVTLRKNKRKIPSRTKTDYLEQPI